MHVYIRKVFLKMLSFFHYHCCLKNVGHMKHSHFTWEAISMYFINLEEAARCKQVINNTCARLTNT